MLISINSPICLSLNSGLKTNFNLVLYFCLLFVHSLTFSRLIFVLPFVLSHFFRVLYFSLPLFSSLLKKEINKKAIIENRFFRFQVCSPVMTTEWAVWAWPRTAWQCVPDLGTVSSRSGTEDPKETSKKYLEHLDSSPDTTNEAIEVLVVKKSEVQWLNDHFFKFLISSVPKQKKSLIFEFQF